MEKIPDIIHPSWHESIRFLFEDPKISKIRHEILPKAKYYPSGKDIFRVFEMPIDDIRVVILGQDPYPSGEATGYAFAVDEGTSTPASLGVIIKEIVHSEAPQSHEYPMMFKRWKTLAHWRQQGVFLLNTALTVEAGVPNSHKMYWSWFVREIVKILSTRNKCIWLLWGSSAKSYKDFIFNYHYFRPEQNMSEDFANRVNLIVEAHHPAAETYPDSKYLFTGCNHFNLCNQMLNIKKQLTINW